MLAKLMGIFNKSIKCSKCGKTWPSKEAYYDESGIVFCGKECVTSPDGAG